MFRGVFSGTTLKERKAGFVLSVVLALLLKLEGDILMRELEFNGYFTILENEILDLLFLLKLTARELRIMLLAVRLLNGFDKEKDRIPLSQFEKITRMAKGHCSTTITKLIKKKMLYRNEGEIGINRDVSQWEGVTKLVTLKGLPKWFKEVTKMVNKGVTKMDPSKETSKETIQRKVLSKSQREEKRKEYKTGLAMLKEAVKRSVDRKRKN